MRINTHPLPNCNETKGRCSCATEASSDCVRSDGDVEVETHASANEEEPFGPVDARGITSTRDAVWGRQGGREGQTNLV
jgi:hypothetical protein